MSSRVTSIIGSNPGRSCARRVGTAERAWLWCKRRPAVAALAASVLLALVAGSTGIIAVQSKANRLMAKKNADLVASNTKLEEQRVRAEVRETQAIDAVKKFRDAVANEPTLKQNPGLDALRKRLLKEPLTFFKMLRDQLQKDHDTRPESLARLASATFDLGSLSTEIGDQQDAVKAYEESLLIREHLASEHRSDVSIQRPGPKLHGHRDHADEDRSTVTSTCFAQACLGHLGSVGTR